MVVGAFGPWAKVLGLVTINGTDDGRDGWIVVAAAAVAAVGVGCFVVWRRRWLFILPVLAGAAAAATAAYDISDIKSLGPSDTLLGSDVIDTGWGIYLALAGSISLVLAASTLWLQTKRQAGTPDAPVPEEAPPLPG
jgi:hypothetical protein